MSSILNLAKNEYTFMEGIASDIFENNEVFKASESYENQKASENEYHGDIFEEVIDVIDHSNI